MEKKLTVPLVTEQQPAFTVWRNPNPVSRLVGVTNRYRELLTLYNNTFDELNSISLEMRRCSEMMDCGVVELGNYVKTV